MPGSWLRQVFGRAALNDSVLSVVTTASSLALNFATSVMTARLLGPVGRGELTAIMLWPLIFAIVGGLETTHETLVYLLATGKYTIRSVVATGTLLAGGLGILLCAIGYLTIPTILRDYPSDILPLARIYFIWIPTSLLGSVAMSVVLGQMRIRLFNVMRLSIPVVSLVGIVTLLATHEATLSSITFVYLLASIFPILIALPFVAQHWSGNLTITHSLVKAALGYAARAHLGSLSGLTNQRADQAMISVFLAPAQLGLYTVAISAASPLLTLGYSLSFVTLPRVASAMTHQTRLEILVRFIRTDVYASVIGLLIGLTLVPSLVPLIFGSGFAGSIASSQVLLVGSAVLGLNRVLNAGLKALNHPLATAIAEVAAMAITIACLLAFLPILGILGAALASLLAYLFSAVFMLSALQRLGLSGRLLVWQSRQDLNWLRGKLTRR